MRRALLPLCLAISGCDQSVSVGNIADNQAGAASEALVPEPMAVRIGELGPSLEACTTAGTTRGLQGDETLPVRSAPFDTGVQTGAIRTGGRFFVCSRSIDQKWFGIVYDDAFALTPDCGVSEPIPRRRTYAGPCKSGWVSSPFVKVIAGSDPLPSTNRPMSDENVSAD